MKFVIDQNAFTGLADALSGRAKQQGQIDGLKIQAAQDQLMANRDKALEPIRQKEAQRNMGISQLMATIKGLTPDKASSMYDYENGQHTNMGFKMNTDGTYAKDEYGAEIIDDTPIDPLSLANEAQWQQGRAILGPLMAMQSYGGDAVDYSKAQGQLNKNGYEAALRQGVMTTQDPSQRNVLVNALSGRSYDPYKTDGYGQMVNTGTGQVQQTAASQAKLGNLNSGTQLNQANAGLAMQRATTEQIKQYEIAADIDLKKIQAQKIEKTNLVEGINNLIEEKTQKVEKSKKALKAEAKKEETPEAAKEKKVKKTQKEKLVDKTKKKVEANLVEEVVTKREVKYIYPADCEDTLSRKKFRQTVRNKIHQLELAMLRIEDQDSKEFKKAKKEYLEYKNQFVKESVAI